MKFPEDDSGREDTLVSAEDVILFGRYRVLREIGRGETGVVLLVRDLELDVEVAIKRVPDLLVRDAEALDDLKREVLRGVTLTHPGIVRTHGFERDEAMGGIVMEYVDGGHFADLKRLQSGGCFDAEDLLPWLEQLAPALDYAHFEIGIAHRDLKPRNLMYSRAGRIKVSDFGISSTLGENFTRVTVRSSSSGTPEYMSPQQVMGERPSHLDDVYSLGATIYELLTGKPPFYRGEILAQVMKSQPEAMTLRRAELSVAGKAPVPAAWEEAIAACLEKNPERRPRSAGELLARLKGAPDRLPPEPMSLVAAGDVPASKVPRRAGHPTSRKPSRMAVPIVVLVATLAGGFVFVEGQKPPLGAGGAELSPVPLRITSPAELPAGTAGTPYHCRLTVEGGSGPRVWSLGSGALPDGLTIDRINGTVEGVPLAAGTSVWLVRVADGEGMVTGKTISLAVRPRIEESLSLGQFFGPEFLPLLGPEFPPFFGPDPALGPSLPGPGELGKTPVPDPEMSLSWEWGHKEGGAVAGVFLKLSGDELTINQEGRERTLPLSHLTDESARRARKFAGLPEALKGPDQPISRPQVQARRRVRAGSFDMGSPSDELGREAGNEMLHRVTLQADFQMKATEVTWAEWNSVRDLGTAYGYTDLPDGLNGVGGDESGQHPVVGISWWDAIKWCNLMSQRDGKKPVYYVNSTLTSILKSGMPPVPAPHVDWKANGYRLPTEAEWEFACRAGLRKREFHTGSIRDLGKDPNLDKAGWYGGNGTHPVGSKTANQLGLYDMHGNAAEWCWDYFGLLKQADAFDPRGAPQGVFRVVRGGSWKDPVKDCRAAARAHLAPALSNRFVGFRWVCAVPAR